MMYKITQKHDIIIYRFLCLILLICAGLSSANASMYQSHASIYKTIEVFVEKQLLTDSGKDQQVKIGKLDSRLKLKKCSRVLHAFKPKGSRKLGKTTIGIKCTGKRPWSLNVPVTISQFKSVLVAASQLQKGSVLQAADLKYARQDLAKLPYGFFENYDDGVGMKLKKRVRADSVITPGMLVKPRIISRGQQITIMAQSGRMTVRVEGEALANGAVGERIKVMNLKTRQKLEGVITGDGQVKVDI